MKAFTWGALFETGISKVDDQHKQLVELTNTFGSELSKNVIDSQRLKTIVTQLLNYARQHFEDEEELMNVGNIDQRHIDKHVQEHSGFLDYVLILNKQLVNQKKESGRKVFEFLSHWLAYHILGSDQIMSSQLREIERGTDPSSAYLAMEKGATAPTAPLLTALNTLFEQVLASNRELIHLNKTLEEQVAERTRELQKVNEDLEILALTDPLTELSNRRYAMRVLHKLWQESAERSHPLSCIMVDADHFKSINDTYGHEAGDAVLVRLARELRHAVRSDDVVCRLGGDEFLVICPSTPLEGALLVANNILTNVTALKVNAGDGFWAGSVSLGVAEKRRDTDGVDALLKLADRGVYMAKKDGKKCVRTIQDKTC